MTNRTSPVRHHSRFPVSWSALYGNDAFLAEGTILDLTARGWRVAGSVPVAPGMQLTLKVSIPAKSTPLCVHRATVLWVHDHEFAIEAHEMTPIDQAWVTEFLRQKLGLMWMSPPTDQEAARERNDKAPRSKTILPQPPTPTLQDILQQLYESDTTLTDMPCSHNDDCQEGETLCDRAPEKTLYEARRILRNIVAMKAIRERTGGDPVAKN